MPRKRRTAKADPLREYVWEEIAGEIAPPDAGRCLCLGKEFADYLQGRIAFSPVLERAGSEGPSAPSSPGFALILGWGVLESPRAPAVLESVHRALETGGEALLFGYCRFPSRDDVVIWERKCREKGLNSAGPLPPPGAVSLSRLAACLAAGPFEHYSVRKKGIYYLVILRR